MDTLEKAELTTLIRHIARSQEYRFKIPKSRIWLAGKHKKAIVKRYAFQANAKIVICNFFLSFLSF